ncbi:MAG TPA: hypothetical protein VMU14_17425, partial [Acidimicrobiales bacterium]|nr:hypothetical protein [Acidimicrobiales bacterium]
MAIERVPAAGGADRAHAALVRDGVVIVEGLLPPATVARVNEEVDAAVGRADPDEDLFDPVLKAFHGPCTKQVTGVAGISPTFATDVVCNSLLLALCDRVLLPN